MEGDRFRQSQLLPQYHFNPLPPHGGRHIPDAEDTKQNHFNPLPPHGGRRCILRRPSSNRGISIHSLRMEGDFRVAPSLHQAIISIHSLRMEGDCLDRVVSKNVMLFQSTPSAWRETLLIASAIHCTQSFQSTPSAWRETCVKNLLRIG